MQGEKRRDTAVSFEYGACVFWYGVRDTVYMHVMYVKVFEQLT